MKFVARVLLFPVVLLSAFLVLMLKCTQENHRKQENSCYEFHIDTAFLLSVYG